MAKRLAAFAVLCAFGAALVGCSSESGAADKAPELTGKPTSPPPLGAGAGGGGGTDSSKSTAGPSGPQ